MSIKNNKAFLLFAKANLSKYSDETAGTVFSSKALSKKALKELIGDYNKQQVNNSLDINFSSFESDYTALKSADTNDGTAWTNSSYVSLDDIDAALEEARRIKSPTTISVNAAKSKNQPTEAQRQVAESRKNLEDNKPKGWLEKGFNSAKETIGTSAYNEDGSKRAWYDPRRVWSNVMDYDNSYEAADNAVVAAESEVALNVSKAPEDLKNLDKANKTIENYKKSQENGVDVISDVAAGVTTTVVVAGAIATGLVAAPFTGGASLAGTAAVIAGAGAMGASIKVALKGSNEVSAGREYTWSQAGYDATTGFAVGATSAATGGISNLVGGRLVSTGIGKIAQFIIKESAEGSVEGSVTGLVSETARSLKDGKSLGLSLLSGIKGMLFGATIGAVTQTGMSGFGKGLSSKASSEVAEDVTQEAADEASKKAAESTVDASTQGAADQATGRVIEMYPSGGSGPNSPAIPMRLAVGAEYTPNSTPNIRIAGNNTSSGTGGRTRNISGQTNSSRIVNSADDPKKRIEIDVDSKRPAGEPIKPDPKKRIEIDVDSKRPAGEPIKPDPKKRIEIDVDSKRPAGEPIKPDPKKRIEIDVDSKRPAEKSSGSPKLEIKVGGIKTRDPKVNEGLPNIPGQTSINNAFNPTLSDDCVYNSFKMIGELLDIKVSPTKVMDILTKGGRNISEAFQSITGGTYRMKFTAMDEVMEGLGLKKQEFVSFSDSPNTPILEALQSGTPAMVNKNGHMVVVIQHNGVIKEMDPLNGYWREVTMSNFGTGSVFSFLRK